MFNKKRLLAAIAAVLMLLAASTVTAETHTHSWSEWKVQVQPTCTETGTSFRECSVSGCDKGGIEYDYNAPAAKGHTWSAYKPGTTPTCTKEGDETRTCSVCNITDTRTLSMLPHDIVGWTTNGIGGKPATCTAEGIEVTYCKTCATKSDSRPVPKLAHKWGDWNPKPGALVTCTTNGTRIRYCSVCASSDEETVTATGHRYGAWYGQPDATCTTDGERRQVCSVCADIKKETVLKLGHSFGAWVPDGTPTCVKAGSKYHVCTRCNFKESEAVPALTKTSAVGHNFPDWATVIAPTCTVAGKQTRTCNSGCGRVETRDIPKLAHTSDKKWVTIKEGDLREYTKQATTCTVCGQPASTQSVMPKGIKMGMPTYAFGALAEQANPALMGSGVRLIWLDQAVDAVYNLPLVTPDNLHIGIAEVTVSNGAVKVSLQKNGETASLLLYRYWQMFPDAQSVTAGGLEGESLPFDQPVQLPSPGAVLVVRTMANYYTAGVNRPFSESETAYDGMSFSEVAAGMLTNMTQGSGE